MCYNDIVGIFGTEQVTLGTIFVGYRKRTRTEERKMKNNNTRSLVVTALFVALILLLGLTPLGLIPLGFINVTILCIPVVVGTIFLGLKTGMVLGACFGLVSTLSAFNLSPLTPPSSLASALVAQNPLLAIVMCMLPRLAVPVATYGVFKLMARGDAHSKAALPFAAAAGSLCNTILYLGLMLLFYCITGLNSSTILALIGGTGLVAGISEAVVAAVVCTPVVYALWKAFHKA